MFVAGSSTTLLGLRLIISLAGCVIIERPLTCVWIFGCAVLVFDVPPVSPPDCGLPKL